MIKLKKGSEKPIEIFVALFVVLAVAMVLLRMFSGQIATEGQRLSDFASRQEAEATCVEVCSSAKTNSCRVEDLVRYCTTNFVLDWDRDSEIGLNNDFPTTMCEDKIYCPLVSECTCGRNLNMQTCIEITRNYFTSNGFPNVDSLMLQRFNFTDGACPSTPSTAWTELFPITTP